MKKLKVLFVISVLSVAAMTFQVPEAKACANILITNDCGNPPCPIEVLVLCGEDAEFCYYC
jgi:hypothetical protein